MPLLDGGLAARLFRVSAVLVLAGFLLTLSFRANTLGREERAHSPGGRLSEIPELDSGRLLTGGCLQRLIHECSRSRRLDLEGLRCEDHVGTHDDFRVPDGNTPPSCGTKVRLATTV